MSPRHKVVFFDLGETLVTQNIEDNMVTKKALTEISRFLPAKTSGQDLFRIYQEGYKVNHSVRSAHHVEIPVETWMLQLLRRALGTEPSEGLVRKAIKTIVTNRAANAVAFTDARRTLQKLAKRKKLGVISNVSSHEGAIEILRRVGLQEYFDRVITSAHTGIRKPDPGIFLYALMEFDIKPQDAVHVGDSEEHDVRGAKSAGITTVLVSRGNSVEDTIADYHFRTLSEAAGLLESL